MYKWDVGQYFHHSWLFPKEMNDRLSWSYFLFPVVSDGLEAVRQQFVYADVFFQMLAPRCGDVHGTNSTGTSVFFE